MKAYKIKNIDGLVFWSVISLREAEEEVIEEVEITEESLGQMSEVDKDFIILELIKLKSDKEK